MGWVIKVYIPVEIEEEQIFTSKEEAEKEVEHLSLLQPENIYEVEEVE